VGFGTPARRHRHRALQHEAEPQGRHR
jgi:hypothetical protein